MDKDIGLARKDISNKLMIREWQKKTAELFRSVEKGNLWTISIWKFT